MKIDYSKYADGLVPAIVQDFNTHKVLMLGFMNEEAVKKDHVGRQGHFLQPQQATLYGRKAKRAATT